MESQKLKTQKLKCYVLGPKSQKFPTAENTRSTVNVNEYYATSATEDIADKDFSKLYLELGQKLKSRSWHSQWLF